MKVSHSKLKGCVIIEPRVFGDERGFFLETFQTVRYQQEAGIDLEFVPDNHSRSARGVLRGLHFQENNPQGKLIKVLYGEIYDVAVDLRKDSNTYGRWIGKKLSYRNKKQLFIPPGFAHGYCALSDKTIVMYKCTDFYFSNDQHGIIWNDEVLNIDWPIKNPNISLKDSKLPGFIIQ